MNREEIELTDEEIKEICDRYKPVRDRLYTAYRASNDMGKMYLCAEEEVSVLIGEIIRLECELKCEQNKALISNGQPSLFQGCRIHL